jgi:hypothetical protein
VCSRSVLRPFFLELAPSKSFRSFVQNAQNIPTGKTSWPPYSPNIANTSILDQTKTNAKLFLTVYANEGLDAVEDSDYQSLATQCM